ncbi:MAG: sugar phosphate isomerase/epimerase family protein [Eubacteriales bacterium]
MIRVGMNLLLWLDSFSLKKDQALIEKVMDMGFDGVEIPVFAGMDMDEAKRLGEYLQQKKIPCTTLSVINPSLGNSVSPDKKLRESMVKLVKDHIDYSVAIGSELLMGPLTQGLGYFSGERMTKQEWQWSVDACREYGEYAAKKDLRIAIEPLNRFEQFILNTAEDAVKYVKDVGLKNVGLIMDTMHMNIEELNVAAAMEYALPYVIHIHISENNRGIPGTGHACGKDVFDVIKKANYSGWLTIEAFNEGAPSMQGPLHLWRAFADSDDALARQGLAYIRSMIK